MISFLALRELTFQTDEISKQSNAVSINSASATKEAKAGLQSRVRGQGRDQARVGDENAGFAAAEGSWWGWSCGAAAGGGVAFTLHAVDMQASGCPWRQPRAGRRRRVAEVGGGWWVWCRGCGEGKRFLQP